MGDHRLEAAGEAAVMLARPSSGVAGHVGYFGDISRSRVCILAYCAALSLWRRASCALSPWMLPVVTMVTACCMTRSSRVRLVLGSCLIKFYGACLMLLFVVPRTPFCLSSTVCSLACVPVIIPPSLWLLGLLSCHLISFETIKTLHKP